MLPAELEHHPIVVGLRQLGEAAEARTDNRLNYGGCGLYALAVSRRLRQLGIPAVCVVGGHKAREDAQRLRTAPEQRAEMSNMSVSHIMVQLRIGAYRLLCDSEYIIPAQQMAARRSRGATSTVGDLVLADWCKRARGWNFAYEETARADVPKLARRHLPDSLRTAALYAALLGAK